MIETGKGSESESVQSNRNTHTNSSYSFVSRSAFSTILLRASSNIVGATRISISRGRSVVTLLRCPLYVFEGAGDCLECEQPVAAHVFDIPQVLFAFEFEPEL